MKRYSLIVIVDCLYEISPALSAGNLLGADYFPNPPLLLGRKNIFKRYQQDNERRLESKVLAARKIKPLRKIIKTQGRIYLTRK